MADAFEVSTTETEVILRGGGTELTRYVYRPETAQREAPKPYLYPVRFLDGGPAAVRRPWDHRWHVGLQFTWSHVDDQNFWGGPTFSAEHGYRHLKNTGSMRHTGFATAPAGGEVVTLDESLQWVTIHGEHWVDEHRVHRFHSLDTERGVWAVDFSTTLTNVRGSTIPLGSPTTAGRPNAGYTGWFWRGPRSWTGCTLIGSDGSTGEDALMGSSEPDWVAFSSEHDELDGGGTVLAFKGSSSSADTHVPPVKWFTRTTPFTVASQSPAFDEKIHLPHGGSLHLEHRFAFINGVHSPESIRQLAQQLSV
ncbi:PmoA family protein [Nesterenkonia alba]|uniref:DUF6807 domain-containing protein n=1 Tax=Nesterenkonia alba TaxID=515814 RepID=UPI0003B36BEF|nr:PmoA family protein [Nesterenkonia alba]